MRERVMVFSAFPKMTILHNVKRVNITEIYGVDDAFFSVIIDNNKFGDERRNDRVV